MIIKGIIDRSSYITFETDYAFFVKIRDRQGSEMLEIGIDGKTFVLRELYYMENYEWKLF